MSAQLQNAASAAWALSSVSPGLLLLTFDISRDSGEQDTGFDFEEGDVILHCYVRVRTAEATGSTKTVDVGLLSSESGGDADGFLDGVSTADIAMVGPDATATDGTNQNFWAAAPKLGALMRTGLLGGDVAGTAGVMIPRPHVIDGTAVSLTTTVGSAASELEAKGYILFLRPQD